RRTGCAGTGGGRAAGRRGACRGTGWRCVEHVRRAARVGKLIAVGEAQVADEAEPGGKLAVARVGAAGGAGPGAADGIVREAAGQVEPAGRPPGDADMLAERVGVRRKELAARCTAEIEE